MAETFQSFVDDLQSVAPQPPVRERPLGPLGTESLQRFAPTGEAIPLDRETGAPFLTRLHISLASDEPTKKHILDRAFAGAHAEAVHIPGKDTQMVIRDYTDPETGTTKDLLVDEKAASWKDMADLGETGIQLLGAYAAIRGGGGMTGKLAAGGLARTVTESLIGSVGGEAAAGLTEAGVRASEDQPVQPGEIAGRRALGAAVGVGMDIGVTAPILGAVKLNNMRRGLPITQEAVNATRARNRLAEETGIFVPFSRAEATGSQSLREREQLLRKHILGGGVLEEQRQAQQVALRKMQEALPGTFGVPSDQLPSKDVAGTQAVLSLRRLLGKAEEGTARARAGAVAEATQELSAAMSTSTGFTSRQVLQDEAGGLARNIVNLKHDVLGDIESELKAEAHKLGADQPFIGTAAAKSKIDSLVRSNYAKEGTADEFLGTTPPSVLKVLEDAQNLPENSTWDGIRNLRNSVNRLIRQGEVLGDTDEGVLKKISKALTESIDAGTKTLPADAAAAVKRANKFYAEGIEQFHVKGITDILADPTQRKLGPFAIFHQAASDPDQYFRLKAVLTKPLMLDGKVADAASAEAGEQAWRVFKQGMWDAMTDSAAKPANRALLDPTKLLNKIEALPIRVREDLLGSMGDTATRSLKRLEALDNPKLPAAEALDILRQGGDKAPHEIMQLALREKEFDKLYDNQIIKKFAAGDIGAESIKPEEFIDRFADSGPIADVRDVMNKLEMASPGITKLVWSKKVQSILDSAVGNPLEDVASAKKLAKSIGGQEAQERLKAVLGGPGTQRLNDFIEMLGYLQHKGEDAALSGGSMAGGAQKAKLLTIVSAIRALPKQIQYRVASMVISNPNIYRMATGPVQPLDPTKLLRAIIVSDDAIKDLVSEYGSEALKVFDTVNSAKRLPTQDQFEQELREGR